ncbi:transglutaminase-like cysteine peptidase [Devosia yakushimensis]|uniref:transglutaminase-like cysteine peptidase n=1 Tax=Devosia yakushimensis TaxID=470028 RepID=UPI0024E0C30B|nr:transglutaminase-like cysteine peptidase [Devosia yakushimensis]
MQHVNRRLNSIFVAFLLISVAGFSTIAVQAAEHRPPLGLQLFCLKHSAQCQATGQSTVAATTGLVQLVQAVNRQVNRSITPRADGRIDTWNATASAGDCEDYVLAKRAALIQQGVPSSALRIGYTKTRQGEGHVVLIVRTGAGEFVLDNLSTSVKLLADSGYRIESSSRGGLLDW